MKIKRPSRQKYRHPFRRTLTYYLHGERMFLSIEELHRNYSPDLIASIGIKKRLVLDYYV